MRRLLVATILCTASVTSLAAQSIGGPTAATIVFDAQSREFRCWTEEPLDAALRAAASMCDGTAGWHPVTAALHFTRGELLSVLVTNAVANDIFSVSVLAATITAPTTPISGAITDLPKLQAIPAIASIFTGVHAKPVAGCAPTDPALLLGLAPTASEEDFKASLDAWVLAPLNSAEVTSFLATDIAGPSTVLISAAPLTQLADDIRKQVNAMMKPTTMPAWITATRSLSMEIDQATALRARIIAAGLPAAVKAINDAVTASGAAAVQCAAQVNVDQLQVLNAAITQAFGNEARVRIRSIAVSHARFTAASPGMNALLERIESFMPAAPSERQLETLKANLNTLADNATAIRAALERRTGLGALLAGALPGAQAQQTQLGSAVAVLVDGLIAHAAQIDSVGDALPLAAPYDLLPLGQWFANQTLTVSLNQGTRLRQFDAGAVSDATRIVVSGDQPAGKPYVAAASPSESRVIILPVYDTYHVKLGFGFAYSSVRDDRFQVDQLTTGTGDAAVTDEYIDQTRSRSSTLLTTVNVLVFPFVRHQFPWRARYDGDRPDPLYSDIAIMAGFGLNNPARDFLIGGAWMRPTSPIGLHVAWHIALRDYPPAGFDITKPLDPATRAFGLHQRTLNGFSAGLVFTTEFFTSVFAAIFKVGT